MSNSSTPRRGGPPPIVFIVLLLGLIGAGYWFFVRRPQSSPVGQTPTATTEPAPQATTPPTTPTPSPAAPTSAPPPAATPAPPTPAPPADPPAEVSFTLLDSVPAGTTVSIDGSTSMVLINESLKAGFLAKYPDATVNTAAVGSDNGIQALLSGDIDIAAVSRSLTPQEQAQGLVAVTVASDQIAIVVGANNPYRRGLSSAQVAQIFLGQVTDWATFGAPPAPIQVINRPAVSGTSQTFQDLVLQGQPFGTGPNITTLARDATTPMLQALGTDGIGYATYTQVANQQTVRVVAIEGLTPEAPTYPFRRPLFYVYRDGNAPAVQSFLGYATSPEGQQAIAAAGL